MSGQKQTSTDTISVYFIENHINTCSPTLSLSGDSGGLFSELEKGPEKQFSEPGKKDQFLYTIYHFDIYPEKIKERGKKEVNLKLTLKNQNDKFDHKFQITDFEKNNYIYDLEFKAKGTITIINPPKSYKFPRSHQFEIFRDYLEKDLGLKKRKDKKREDLVFFTKKNSVFSR